jgi:thiamine pyrophosphokinase
MKALILANGELHDSSVLRRRVQAESFDLVLGADGGASFARTLGLRLDGVIGDLDSLSPEEQLGLGDIPVKPYTAEKDETDLELALRYAQAKGVERVVVVGALGARMDMTVANLFMIADSSLGSCRVEIWHGEQTGWLIKPPGEDIP